MAHRRSRFVGLLGPYWKVLTIAFIAMLVEAAAGLLEPWPLKVIFDSVLGTRPPPAWMVGLPWPGGGPDRLRILDAAALAVIGIALVGAIGSYAGKYLSTTAGQHVMHDLRHALYHHVQRLSLSFYEQRRTGDLVVRLTSDIDAIQDFVSSVLLGMVLDVLTLAGMLAVMLYLDWRFTFIAVSIAPVLFPVVYRLTRRMKSAAREVKKKESELASVVQETIASARVVKAFAREDYEERRLDEQSLESVEAALRARSIKARLTPAVDIIIAAGTCAVLMIGARLVLNDRLTTGALLVFVLYLGRMYKPMKDLSKMADTVSKATVAAERVSEVMDIESQVRNLAGARAAPAFRGAIEFDHVSFGYAPGQPVLRDVSFAVAAGQPIALVGPTGCGKSTVLGLLPRFYDVWDGQIRIDGVDVRRYTLKSLRDQISLVLQDTILFRASVWQNIAYGNPRATHDDIVRAAKAANVHDFISRLPEGYDTIVGERGETLSGGQRQRIGIARAVIRNAPILLLDEPSAALDPESEELIFQALARLTEGRTSITVAHRLSTVRRASMIFVMDEGAIVDHGTHEELLGRPGLYARLYGAQHLAEMQARAEVESRLLRGA